MRRSPADSTNRSLAAFGKLQHIRIKRRSRAPASGTLLAGESFTITVLIGRDLNRRQPPRAFSARRARRRTGPRTMPCRLR